MIDAQKILSQVLGGGAGGSRGGDMLGDIKKQAAANPLATGVIAGGLAAILLGSKGKGLTGQAVKLGGLGLIGSLAYKAWQEYQAKQAGQTQTGQVPQTGQPQLAPPPADTPFTPPASEAEDRARLLLTAMISAAKADGSIDAAEQQKIFDRVDQLDVNAETKAYLMDQLRTPLDLDGIVRAVKSPEVATEVYAASVLAIDPDHAAEKAYLQMLAARLGLADDLVQEIHRTADTARAAA
jgi:uncharacterized membrane protein YebE (DUF533 family)